MLCHPPSSDATADSIGAGGRVFALLGNPNCGKTTLFNALTGLRQKVGNYAGVTVDCKVGEVFGLHGERFHVIDLPGAYSLAARSPDETVAQDVLLGRREDVPKIDAVVCVLDASILERSLYLATQVIELGLPVILVLRMLDTAKASGITVNVRALSEKLGVPVVKSEGDGPQGVLPLRIAMSRAQLDVSPWRRRETDDFRACEDKVMEAIARNCRAEDAARLPSADDLSRRRVCARMMITGDAPDFSRAKVRPFPQAAAQLARTVRADLDAADPHWKQARIAERYAAIGQILEGVLHHRNEGRTLTDRIDALVLHPFVCWLVLMAVLGVVFYSVFWLAQKPMEWIEAFFEAASGWLTAALPAGFTADLLTDGVLAGVGAVMIFLPQIILLFFFLALLESTGYLARATFILDRVMHAFGLHGRSFIPMLSGYACAVPGIMATRTIESSRDRIATILVLPWMSCSARLPVYLLMIAAIYPGAGPWVTLQKTALLLGMYMLGTVSALGAAWLWSKTILRGQRAPFMMELPPYHRPHWKQVFFDVWEKVRVFLRNAGTIILAISIILWALLTHPSRPGDTPAQQLERSVAGQMGKAIEPAIEPLGFNWKIGIGLIASFGAREVFVSTMNIIYNVETSAETAAPPPVLQEGFGPAAAGQLSRELRMEERARGYGFTPLVCVSLMVFYVYALQCMSTLAVAVRETRGWRWPLFMLLYMTAAAYAASFAVYQIGCLLGFS